jgi:scytalone dehydratase
VDYRSFLNKLWEEMPAEQFVAMASDPKFLGNPLLKTQHFIGATRWEKISDSEMIGHHQVRVAHQKYDDISFKTVAVKGHSHGSGTIWYKKVAGVWKFAGVCPNVRWFEYNYDQVFTDSRDHFNNEPNGS